MSGPGVIAQIADLRATFAALAPPPVNGAPSAAATDPFEVLLQAASTGTSPGTSESTGGPVGTGATSVATSLTPAYDPVMLSGAGAAGGTVGAADTAASPLTGAPTTPSGAAIVDEAARQIGVPYVWGGTSPSGFDCSGLVQYTLGQLGVDVPRTAAEQEQAGTPVASLADAQPGDLLFFEPGENGAPPGEAGHVAIYIGDGKMIAAPRTGEDVGVESVPGTPLAIRRVTVPAAGATGSATAAGTGGSYSPAAGGGVQMGGVAVPAAYAGLVEQASASTGTPAAFLAAILEQESGYNPNAVSSTGAQGIAQFEPATAAAHGVNPLDPSSAIPGAASMLASLHAEFGSWSLAAAAYNAGPAAVSGAGGVPDNGQTPAYVRNVLAMAGMPAGT